LKDQINGFLKKEIGQKPKIPFFLLYEYHHVLKG
jgi:hypothetical protein